MLENMNLGFGCKYEVGTVQDERKKLEQTLKSLTQQLCIRVGKKC
jgi:hypothetical protein